MLVLIKEVIRFNTIKYLFRIKFIRSFTKRNYLTELCRYFICVINADRTSDMSWKFISVFCVRYSHHLHNILLTFPFKYFIWLHSWSGCHAGLYCAVVGTNPTWGVLCVRLIYCTGNIPNAVVVKKKFEGSIFQAKIFVSFYDAFLKCAGWACFTRLRDCLMSDRVAF